MRNGQSKKRPLNVMSRSKPVTALQNPVSISSSVAGNISKSPSPVRDGAHPGCSYQTFPLPVPGFSIATARMRAVSGARLIRCNTSAGSSPSGAPAER